MTATKKTTQGMVTLRPKRTFVYIILIALFTVVLCLDVVNVATFPAVSVGMTGMTGQFTMETGDADADTSGTEAEFGGMTRDFSDADTSGTEAEFGGMAGGFSGAPGGDMGDMADQSGVTAEVPSDGEMAQGAGGMGRSGGTADGAASDTAGEEMTLPDGMSDSASAGSVGALYTVRSALRTAWIPILIVCVLGDGGCIFLLLRARRYNRQLLAASAAQPEAENGDGEEDELSPRRRKRRLWMIPVALLLVVALVLGLLPTLSTSSTSSVTVNTEILSGTVETGTLDTVLSGTGTLEEEDAVELTLPDTVTVETYYVSNGDTVEEGDLIAAVDSVSVAVAIVNLQADLDALDEDLAEAAEDTLSDTVTATAGGRVKVIYAEEDISVVDTMDEYGALMLVSLDGLLAVDVSATDSLTVGDSVTVTLPDGTEEDGRVAQLLDGVATVTVSDEDTDYGDSVTVTDADGNELGSGALYIHSELKVTGYYGTVEDIEVDVDDAVDAGDDLLTLTDVGGSADYLSLLSQREELEAQMQELYLLYMDNNVYAETAGVISGLSDSAAASTDSDDSADSTDSTDSADSEDSTDSSETTAAETAASTVSFVLNLLTTADTTDRTAAESVTLSETELTLTEGESVQLTAAVSPEDWSGEMIWASSDETVATVDSGGLVTWVSVGECMITVTADDQMAACAVTCQEATEVDSLTLSTRKLSLAAGAAFRLTVTVSPGGWSGEVTWASGDETVATVDSDGLVTWVSPGTCTVSATADGCTATCLVICQEETEATEGSEGSAPGEDGSTASDGNAETGAAPDAADGTETAGDADADGMTDQTDSDGTEDMTGMTEDMTGMTDSADSTDTADIDTEALYESALEEAASSLADGTSDTSDGSGTAAAEEEGIGTYSVGEQTILSITPQDTMTISISVDELDILSLTEGQEAVITLDALTGQSFSGTVTALDTSGTNSGGNTKFTAEITMERTGEMLVGMNASVLITLATTEDVLVIPEAALVEEGSTTYVYTSYDTSSETLGDLVEVETGVSDGTNVEICSGLSSGDSYYYSYADSLSYTFVSGISGFWS
ncbi:MAG: Ig-like domain-containing protein [Clostridiales bacterium]|nr:Ig-like domain-containing protein [Clostridiales bacterium]